MIPPTGSRGLAVGMVAWLALILSGSNLVQAEQNVTKTWAMAEFGEPLYKDGFEHWPYADPDAPKGGKIVLSEFGSFDSFNAVILKGKFPYSIGHLYHGLMTQSGLSSTMGSPVAGDELMSVYGQIAETAEYPEDKSWIIFNLRPEARFTDGAPITAEDFVFGFHTIRDHGRPFLKSFYKDVEGIEALSDHRLKFTFKTRNSMKPLMIVAEFSPMPRHFWAERDVTKTTLEPPPGSGAYRIKSVDPGRAITYERVKDYWAADLPVSRGLHNFDEIRYEHYRDRTVEFEAFRAGKVDFRVEGSAKRWATGYDSRARENGNLVMESLADEMPRGVGAYFLNLKRPHLMDRRVREAIGYLYDFESIQRTLLFGHYKRATTYFPNSDYGASGPPTTEEIAILEPFRDQLPPEVLTEPFVLPRTDGSGRSRANQRKALALFKDAGWALKDGKLTNIETGEQLKFEIMTASPETKRITLPFIENLKRAGIDATLRFMDVAQWRNRVNQKDFDVYAARNNFFPPPGTELRSYFGTELPGQPGSGNRSGYSSPVADALIGQIIEAKDLETLKVTTRALDRVLLWNFNIVPQFYRDEKWLAYWNKFGRPAQGSRYNHGFPSSWWLDEKLAGDLAAR